MIPQRHISLLANRLLKEHGGRRIPEAVLERDYCLAWFLVGLSQSRLRELLIFKGGTALKRCHFGDYRFSEDLDFTLARAAEFGEIREGLEEIYESLRLPESVLPLTARTGRTISIVTPSISAIRDLFPLQIMSRWISRSRKSYVSQLNHIRY
jgi:hypothetical protein